LASPIGYQPDYGWFTPADTKQLFRAIHKLPDWEKVVLVGGQALTTWVFKYKIDLLSFDGPYLTQDADFLGSRADAELIAKHLGGKAMLAHMDDHTVNTAVIEFTGKDGRRLLVDMLGVVLGLKDEDTRRLAVAVQLYDDWEPIRVLHPLLVLESRCANLEMLANKRTANGITQAKVAVLVAKAYIEECLLYPERRREALKAARRIAALAVSRSGVYVWKQWQIDVLEAVDPENMPGRFWCSWKYVLQKVQRKREIALKRDPVAM
jgi:hypothetical protein